MLMAAAAAVLLLLWDLRDERLGGQQERRDRRRVLQRAADDLRRIDDAGLHQVLVDLGGRVEALVLLHLADLRDDDGALGAGVGRDVAHRLFDRAPHDLHADELVAFELELVEHLGGAHQGHAAARHDPFLDSRLGRVHRILDAGLLLLHLGLGGGTDLDDRDAADELRQALLELLAVVVRAGLFDLRADLLHTSLDGRRRAAALDDRRVVLVDGDLLGLAEILELDVLELDAEVFGDRAAAGEDRDVLEHRLAAIAEAGSLDRGHLQRAAQLVDDQRRQRFTLDVLCDDQQRTAEARHLLEHGQQILHRADLLLVDQDDRVLQDRFHALGIGDEVGGKVAAIELHAFNDVQRRLEGLRFFDGDDAVLADLVHRFRDDLADRLVAVGGNHADLRHHVARHRPRHLFDLFDDRFDGLLDAALQLHRVRAGNHVPRALAVDRLRQHGRRRRAVAGRVGRLARDLADHLRAHVFERILQVDLLRHRHPVLGDGGGSELPVEDDVTALRAEGDFHRVGELIDAAQDRLARLLSVNNLFCHCFPTPYYFFDSRIARTSSSRMMRYSSPSILISCPEYLPKRMVSPSLTSSGWRAPSSLNLPWPVAMTLPCCGFSLALSGMMIPPTFCSPSSMRETMMRSCSGLTFMCLRLRTGCDVERTMVRVPRGGAPCETWRVPAQSASTQYRQLLILAMASSGCQTQR